MERGGKRGQVTLFIILGIILVAGIIATSVLLLNVEPETNTPEILGPRAFIDKCVRDAVEVSVEKIILGGGEIEPSLTIMHNSTNYTYLCHHPDLYKTCYNLHPTLESDIEKVIKSDTNNAVSECFNAMREDFENRGYDVIGNDTYYSISILSGEIKINLEKSITISKDDTSQNFNSFNTKIIHPLHEILRTVHRITTSESQHCYFDATGHMLLYPQEKIRIINYQSSKLYRIINRKTNIEFKFAVRGCVRPAGLI